MPDHHRLLKRTPIREVARLLDIEANVVRDDDDLVLVARRAFAQPQTRVLSVVDAAGRLVGLLPVLRIVEDVVARAAPEELMAEITSVEAAVRFGREVGARTARDLMTPPLFLRQEDTIADAFSAMHVHHLSGLPLVDDAGVVVGYVDVLELALRYLAELETGRG